MTCNDRDESSVIISHFQIEDEEKAHPLAMRTYWEIIPLASSYAMRHPVKVIVMSVIMYLTTTTATCHLLSAGTTNLHLFGTNNVLVLPNIDCNLLILCITCECLCTLLPYTNIKLSTYIGILSGTLVFITGTMMHNHSDSTGTIYVLVHRLSLHVTVTYIINYIYVSFINSTVYHPIPDYENLHSYWLSGKHVLFVAKTSGAVCGTLGMVHHNDTIVILKRMAVSPESRGLGVATKLIRSCLRHCRDMGYKYILLNVTNFQQPALKLYRKLGFIYLSTDYFYCWYWYWEWYYMKVDGNGGKMLGEDGKQRLMNSIRT